MNSLKLFLLLVILLPMTVWGQIPVAGLIAHWPFTDTTKDISVNALHATPYYVAKTTGKKGYTNTAYRFDSVVSHMSVPYNSLLNPTQLTICAVLKPEKHYTATCQGNYIISRGVPGTSGSYTAHYYDNAYNDCSTADTNSYVFGYSVGTVLSPNDSFKSTKRVHTGQWYCVIFTYQGSEVKVYVDGTLVASSTIAAGALGMSVDSLSIGRYMQGGSGYPYNFIGVLDDIAFYNRVLLDTEINNYCNKAPEYKDTSMLVHTTVMNTDVSIYPNPGNGIFTISGYTNSPITDIAILNMQGVTVYTSRVNISAGNMNTKIDLTDLPSGSYVIRLAGKEYIEHKRLFVK